MSVFLFSSAETKRFSSEAQKSLSKNLAQPADTESMYPTHPLPINKNDNNNKLAPSPTSPLAIAPYPSFGNLELGSLVTSFNSKSTSQNSFDIYCNDDEEDGQIVFPSYDDDWFDAVVKDLELSARQRADSWTDSTGSSYSIPSSPTSESPESPISMSTTSSRAESPEPAGTRWVQYNHKDDSAIRGEPDQCVDYLSHEWAEADFWASWKYTRSNSGAYNNGHRLENAIWRSWIKSANNLKTVPPSTVNWRKDADNTWLYGPLQKGSQRAAGLLNPAPRLRREVTIRRKPVNNAYLRPTIKSVSEDTIRPVLKTNLKKRATSDIMQERSLYTISLLKQPASSVHEKTGRRRNKERQSAPVETTASTKKQVKFDVVEDCIPHEIRRERERANRGRSQTLPKFPPPPKYSPPAAKSKKIFQRPKSTSDVNDLKSSGSKKSKAIPNLRIKTRLTSISEAPEKHIEENSYRGLGILPESSMQKRNINIPLKPISPNSSDESPSCKSLLTATLGRPDSFVLTQDYRPMPRKSPTPVPIAQSTYNWKISSISSGTLRYYEDEYDIMARAMFGPPDSSLDMAIDKTMLGAF